VQLRQGDFGRQNKQASPHPGDVYGEAETVQFTIPALPAGCQNPPERRWVPAIPKSKPGMRRKLRQDRERVAASKSPRQGTPIPCPMSKSRPGRINPGLHLTNFIRLQTLACVRFLSGSRTCPPTQSISLGRRCGA